MIFRRRIAGVYRLPGGVSGLAQRWRPAIGIGPIGLDLGRRLVFISRTKWTETSANSYTFAHKVRGPLGTIRRNNDPTPYDRVFSKFRHVLNPFSSRMNLVFYDTRNAFLNNSMCAVPGVS